MILHYEQTFDGYGHRDENGLYFDLDASQFENFEDMYEGQFEMGLCILLCYDIGHINLTDYKDIWENKLSEDYFEIDCDMSEYIINLKRQFTPHNPCIFMSGVL